MPTADRLPVGLQMLRGAGIFQAIVALPICIFLGCQAFISVLEPWSWMLYYFIADTTSSIMAASIIFSVYVQRKATISSYQYFLFEAFKSAMATGLWLWLILDAAFGPWIQACRKESWCHWETGPRVTRAALASVVLFVFYYPPLGYSYLVWKDSVGKEGQDEEGVESTEEETERSPLLG